MQSILIIINLLVATLPLRDNLLHAILLLRGSLDMEVVKITNSHMKSGIITTKT